MKNDKLVQALAIVLAVLTIGYFSFSMISAKNSGYQTSTVYVSTVSETIDAEMFVIRDEQVLTTEKAGVVVSLVGNGEKIAGGSKVAAVFSDESAAENYSASLSLENKLETYKKIDTQVKLANVDLDKLTEETNAEFIDILDAVYYNNYNRLSDTELSFSEKLSRKNISLGYDVDCSAKISSLESQIKTLQAVSPDSIVTSSKSGYYVSRPDGYESVLTVEDIDTLTDKQLMKAMESEKKEIPKNSIGKVINGFDWYVACLVPSESLTSYETGVKVSILFGESENETVSASLYRKQICEDGKCLAVFRCSFMNEELSALRKVSGKIVLKTYTGLKIRKDAIRFNASGQEGVYIMEGNLIKFNRIEEIYSDSKYVVADDTITAAGWLSQYDEVVVSGKELENGKVIG